MSQCLEVRIFLLELSILLGGLLSHLISTLRFAVGHLCQIFFVWHIKKFVNQINAVFKNFPKIIILGGPQQLRISASFVSSWTNRLDKLFCTQHNECLIFIENYFHVVFLKPFCFIFWFFEVFETRNSPISKNSQIYWISFSNFQSELHSFLVEVSVITEVVLTSPKAVFCFTVICLVTFSSTVAPDVVTAAKVC